VTAPTTKVVVFRTGSGRYAIDVDRVASVHRAGDVQLVPDPRPGVLGMTRIADDNIPVVIPFGPAGAYVVLVEGTDRRFGLAVDEIVGLVEVAPGQLEGAPPGQRDALIGGVLGGSDGITLVVDVDLVEGLLR
jgi:chemotaxis signal transduction protein